MTAAAEAVDGPECTVMGGLLLVSAVELFAIAILLAPTARRIGIDRTGRHALTAVLVTLASYLAWISGLFFAGRLGPDNYTPALWAVRAVLVASCSVFLWSAWRCRRKLMRGRRWSDAGR